MIERIKFFLISNVNQVISWLSLVIFFVIWEVISDFGIIEAYIISSPSEIYLAAIWLFNNGFWNDIAVSTIEFSLGFSLALLVGIVGGIVLGWYDKVHAIFNYFISALYATPRVALMPILIIWLGLGMSSKVAIVFLGAVFPILVNVITGIRAVDSNLLKCARSFGASDRQIFYSIALPNSLPFILTGIRLAIGRGLVGIVVGELVASTAGVGHMMSVAASTFQTDKVFVGIILISTTGIILTSVMKYLEGHFSKWKNVEVDN